MVAIPTGFSQVNLKFTGVSVATGAEVTFGVDNGTDLAPEAIAAIVIDALDVGGLVSLMVQDCDLTSVLVKNGPTATGPSAEVGATLTGEFAGDGTPPNTSVLARKNTAFGGRAGRGRMYWPGLPDTKVSGTGLLDGTWLSNWQDLMTAFLFSLTSGDIDMVVLHGAGSPLSTPTPVTSIAVDSKVATQRRRLRR